MQHYLYLKKIINTPPPKTSRATIKEMIYNQLCHGLQEPPNTIACLPAAESFQVSFGLYITLSPIKMQTKH